MNTRFVTYYRVSTTRQGESGLGLEAQQHSVAHFIEGRGEVIGEFQEVESGTNNEREQLAKAIDLCRKRNATLCLAKLDRASRNAAFLLNLRDSGVDFVAVDMPHADKFTVGIMALVAEKERDMISQRTRDGLAAAKRRGTRLGNPNPAQALKRATEAHVAKANRYSDNLLPVIREIQKAGVSSLRGIAGCLNARGFKTPRGRAFEPQTVKNLLAKAG